VQSLSGQVEVFTLVVGLRVTEHWKPELVDEDVVRGLWVLGDGRGEVCGQVGVVEVDVLLRREEDEVLVGGWRYVVVELELVELRGLKSRHWNLLPDCNLVVQFAIRPDNRLAQRVLQTEHSAIRHGLNLVARLHCVGHLQVR
jgi:hypothetical protein